MAHIEKDLTKNKLTNSFKKLAKLLPQLKEKIVEAAQKDLGNVENLIKMQAETKTKRQDLYNKLKVAKKQNDTLVKKLKEEDKERRQES